MLTKPQPEPDLFSYAALSREDEASAREDAALIRTHVEDMAKKGIEIGQALLRQKERMAHGAFMAWIRSECGIGYETAKVMMRVAGKVAANGYSNTHLAALSIQALDLFFADNTPLEVRDRIETLLVDGQKVTVADIRQMKTEAKQAVERAEALSERNADLARNTPEPALIETIVERPEESEARIRDLEERVRRLSEANTQRAMENNTLREKLAQKSSPSPAALSPVDPPNVIRATFGLPEHEGDPDRFETGDLIDKEPDLRLHNFVETVIDRPNPSGGASIRSKAYDMDREKRWRSPSLIRCTDAPRLPQPSNRRGPPNRAKLSPETREATMSHINFDRVRLTLSGAEVVPDFRSALYEEANKAGVSPNEFTLRATAEKLAERGHHLAGLFEVGDIDEVRL